MKRFLSRFSNGSVNTASPPSLSQNFDAPREKDGLVERIPAPAPKANPSNSRSTGQRVKALAAKYEAHTNKRDATLTSSDARASKLWPPDPNLDPQVDLPLFDTRSALLRSLPSTTPASDASPPAGGTSAFEDCPTTSATPPAGPGLDAVVTTLEQGCNGSESRPLPKRIPQTPSSSLAKAERPQRDVAAQATTFQAEELRRQAKDQRQPSASSHGSAGTSSGPKSVAFAPSPEKPSQSSQHGHQPPRSASPGLVTSAASAGRPPSGDSMGRSREALLEALTTSNFAKPTVASQARAKTLSRHSGSDAIGWNGFGAGAPAPISERAPNPVASKATKLSRANSLQSSSRRPEPGSNGSNNDHESPNLTISSPTMMGSPAVASTSSLGHGMGHGHASGLVPTQSHLSPETNSIPFASISRQSRSQAYPYHHPSTQQQQQSRSQVQVAARSNSPVSFSTHTSVPMQSTGSGSGCGHNSRSDSRRGSFAPASYGSGREGPQFSFGSLGSKHSGVPSWSEMTHEELVHNLGPRERTRQEVLWEIVASEERYVAELEKAKELYVDALLHPDQFDPDRLFCQTETSLGVAPGAEAGLTETGGGASEPRTSGRSVPTPTDARTGPSSAADLPIAARFMSGAAASPRDETRYDSALDHQTSLYRPDSAAEAQVEAQRAAGTRSPYSAGLLRAVEGGAQQEQQQQQGHKPRPQQGTRRNSMNSSTGHPRTTGTSGQSGAASRGSLAHGLGVGIAPAKFAATQNGATGEAFPEKPRQSRRSAALSKVQKLRDRSRAAGEGDPMILAVPLPRSIRAVLECISDGLVESHALLSEALKARYEEQWPLVRSLADVFMHYSYVLKHYAAYVCHLQRALEELEEAALMERAMRGKRLKKERLSHTVGLGRTVSALEAAALERGHGGLSIFVSLPFQRLLKYPLLFQNLLFHTDPSTHEFESTVAMVVEVERLVRSIEDEKVNAEERDKTRDAFARIESLTDKRVLRPRSDRTLVEEKALYDENQRRTVSESAPRELAGPAIADASDHEGAGGGGGGGGGGSGGSDTPSRPVTSRWNASPGLRAALRNKRSYRRLSDFLSVEDKGATPTKAPSMGSKKDLWLVRFSDVEIKCQRVGVTALPMVSSAALTSSGVGNQHVATMEQPADESMDFARRSKESKERLKALRSTTLRAKTRNLYKFVSVVAWRNAAVGSRSSVGGGMDSDGIVEGLPTSHEVDEEADLREGESDSDSSDGVSSSATASSGDEADAGPIGSDRYVRQSKLSFSYWGDKVEPRIAGRAAAVSSGDTGPASSGAGSSSSLVNASSVAAYRSLSGQNSSVSAGKDASGKKPGGAATRIAARPRDSNRPISSSSGGRNGGGAAQRRASSPSKRSSLGAPGLGGGMSSRLTEPMSATSIHSASEAMQAAVAHMHAKQRNDKFGSRLRTVPTTAAAAWTSSASVPASAANPDGGD